MKNKIMLIAFIVMSLNAIKGMDNPEISLIDEILHSMNSSINYEVRELIIPYFSSALFKERIGYARKAGKEVELHEVFKQLTPENKKKFISWQYGEMLDKGGLKPAPCIDAEEPRHINSTISSSGFFWNKEIKHLVSNVICSPDGEIFSDTDNWNEHNLVLEDFETDSEPTYSLNKKRTWASILGVGVTALLGLAYWKWWPK